MTHGAAQLLPPTRIHLGQFAQSLNVLPFAQPHRNARLRQADVDIKGLLKGFNKNLRWRKGAEIYRGAGPVEYYCVNLTHAHPHCSQYIACPTAASKRSISCG
ncbi:hypothetical protein D3C76_1678330 [compost metagenome]